MAKWGAGDPRWIVEERPDATNVNNWHWTEKNADLWSKQRLKELLVGSVIEGDVARCVITDLNKCDGEAVVNNRKGKLIFLYEWDIMATWKGTVNGSTTTVEGKVNVPNLSEEHEISEIEVYFAINDAYTSEATTLHQFLVKNGQDVIREKLAIYVKNLKEDFPTGLILPKKNDDNNSNSSSSSVSTINNACNQTKTTSRTFVNKSYNSNAAVPEAVVNSKLSTKTLQMTQTFQCTASDMYTALTDPKLAKCYASDGLVLEAKTGGTFKFFSGNVYGTFRELIPSKKIVQTWRLKEWPPNHYSLVTITIEQQQENTLLTLVQTDVPASECDMVHANWNRYYWDPMKRILGFGSFIL